MMFGETTEMRHIITNLMVIGLTDTINAELNKLKSKAEYVHTFYGCGRYLCFIKIFKNKDKGVMLFFDNNNDDTIAKKNSTYLADRDFRTYYMRDYKKWKHLFELNYNTGELFKWEQHLDN